MIDVILKYKSFEFVSRRTGFLILLSIRANSFQIAFDQGFKLFCPSLIVFRHFVCPNYINYKFDAVDELCGVGGCWMDGRVASEEAGNTTANSDPGRACSLRYEVDGIKSNQRLLTLGRMRLAYINKFCRFHEFTAFHLEFYCVLAKFIEYQ